MREPDDISEVEPLVPSEQVRGMGKGLPSFQITPQHITKDFKSLEIVSAFVVAFDTQHGNVIEWAKPEFMKEQLRGLEFKAIPSGAHTLQEDIVYLYDAELYGVACYGKISVDNMAERGARMRSVGVLAHSDALLHIHIDELKAIVRHVLAQPGDYSPLEEYFQRWSGDFITKNASFLSTLNIDLPCHQFEHLLSYLGASIFTVWKAIALQKRIMFYGQPPAAYLCQMIHCLNATMYKSHKMRKNLCTPFYSVNIADCDVLSRQVSYIACTTEKVFETKQRLYDVYVDCGTVRVDCSRLRPIFSQTRGDRLRIEQLFSILRQPLSCDEDAMTTEDNFYTYFGALNSAIGEKLHALSTCDIAQLTSKDLADMGLYSSDSAFVNELLESFNLDTGIGCMLCDCIPG